MRISFLFILLICIVSCSNRGNSEVDFSFKTFEFENLEFDTGEAEEYLIINNRSSSAFVIDTIIAKCGCTVLGYDFELIKPHEKDSLLVKYNTDFPGYFSRDFIIYSNNLSSPDVFTLKGNVRVK